MLLFRFAEGRFDLRKTLLDVGARGAFVPDQPIEFDFTFGGARLGGLPVSAGTVVGGLQRGLRVGQLPLEGASGRRGVGELRGERSLALREPLDLGGTCVKRLPGLIERRRQLTGFAAKSVSGLGSLC